MNVWTGGNTHAEQWRDTPLGSSLPRRKPRLGSSASPTCRTLPCLSGNQVTRSELVRGSWEMGCQTFRPRSTQPCSTGSAWVFWKATIQQLEVKGNSCKAPRFVILANRLKWQTICMARPLCFVGQTLGLGASKIFLLSRMQPIASHLTELHVKNPEYILKLGETVNIWLF